MSDHEVAVVRVKHEGFEDGVLINESDFVVGEHELFEDPSRRNKPKPTVGKG